MKLITPLTILTTTIGLFFAHNSIADDNAPPARFYDRKDLPEISEKMSLPKKAEREHATESFDIDREALFSDERDDSPYLETGALITEEQDKSLPTNITKYPVTLERIDGDTVQHLKITAQIPQNTTNKTAQF